MSHDNPNIKEHPGALPFCFPTRFFPCCDSIFLFRDSWMLQLLMHAKLFLHGCHYKMTTQRFDSILHVPNVIPMATNFINWAKRIQKRNRLTTRSRDAFFV